ncbi:MAG TPA: glycosyltransferase, partial [Roseiflexaceae bacterium]|nr:glycosyltransferase [Roseiflexaceae bacterium]
MRIWLLTSQFPPTIAGGIARYVANAAEMFAQGGHEVVVLAADTSDGEEILRGGARLVRFRPRATLRNQPHRGEAASHPAFPYNVLSYWPALSYEIAERASMLAQHDGVLPDVIECQEYAALPYYLIQRRLTEDHVLGRTPVVVHLHSPDFGIRRANQEPQYRLPSYWVGRMESFAIAAADRLLAPSQFLRDDVVRSVPQVAPRIDVIPYPYANIASAAATPTPGDVVFFGRLEVRKGVPPLVEVCARLWAQGHEFNLTLIGEDTLFSPRGVMVGAYLRTRYAQWIDRGRLVIHDSALHPPALWQRLAAAWAVVIPSTWENYPNTCIEAMQLGCCVIASTAGGQAEMIGDDGSAGVLFDWSQPGSCEAALLHTLSLSASEIGTIGERAKARITALTAFDHVLPLREAHFERTIASFQGPASFPSSVPHIPGRVLAPQQGEQSGLLSVVVPFYNLGNYIEATIDSIAVAGYSPKEIVVIDDGSDQPESLEALERARVRHAGLVRVIRTQNGGLAQARNTGADAARGEYLAFVDADDLVEKDFFERAVHVLQRYSNVSFVYSWVRFFGDSNDVWPTFNTELPYLLGHNMLTAFVVLRRSHFHAFGRNDPTVSYALEDHEAWLRMVAQGCIGVSIPDPLVRYRIRNDSMLQKMNEDQGLYLTELIAQRHPDLYKQYGAELFALQNANGPSLRWNHPAAEQIDFRARYFELLGAHQRLLRFLRPAAPAVKALRTLK